MNSYFLNNEICIYDVDFKYRVYLRSFDNKVNTKDGRRYVGIIIVHNDIKYFIPLTSKPLRSNGKRRNQRTTVEIKDGETLIGALLINNMIPVPDGSFSKVDIENDRHKDYLNKEYIYIKNYGNQILNKIKNVYNDVTIRNDSFMSAFCCDFKLLEEKSKQWTAL